MKTQLAQANKILFNQAVLDAFGHVSARDPDNQSHFFLSRNLAPALVKAEDIMAFDLDGNPQERLQEKVYLERFLHGAIYRERPDVQAIVHSHSASLVPFTVVPTATLRPICHMGGFLTSKSPIFEIRDHVGDHSDLLIRDIKLGAALAKSLANHAIVLMRGHGVTVVGGSLQQAVFRAVYAEKNATIQAQAMALGEPTYLTDSEASNADLANQGQVQRAWDFWAMQAEHKTI